MDIAEPTLIVIATVLMLAGLLLAFVPIMPGPALLWAVSVIFGALEGFERMTPAAVIAATVIMILGSASDLWLPLFGIRGGRSSCQSTIGAFAGGMLGTFLIPLPVIGTLVGCVLGALVVEWLRMRELRQAVRAGQHALKMVLYSYVVQLIASIAIFAVYAISVQSTV